jgi:hypothetical protein
MSKAAPPTLNAQRAVTVEWPGPVVVRVVLAQPVLVITLVALRLPTPAVLVKLMIIGWVYRA